MTAYEKINDSIKQTNSILCIGLDSDIEKLPDGIAKNVEGIFLFNQRIIEKTYAFAAAYKVNFAFYEQYGTEGFNILKKTIDNIPNNRLIIADAKRGDIGNTSSAYAKACFDYFGCDAVTVNPYMGFDSVSPFLEYKDKFVFLLALTSNKGSQDFQYLESDGRPLYRHVIEKSKEWGSVENLGYVVGATHSPELSGIRELIPDHFLLIPGIGTQGGNVPKILIANNNGPAIINVSRDIIYSSDKNNFDDSALLKAKFYKDLFNL